MPKITIEHKEIIDFYLNGNSLKITANNFNISSGGVRLILKKNNIKTRSWLEVMGSKVKLSNEYYFSNINSPDKAYFLGWMVSDGWINEKGLGIALQDKDKYILELFKKYIEYEGNIGTYLLKSGNRMNYLILTSQKIKDDLAKYGVIRKKTHFTYFPDIPEEFYSHFIRGVFDGDGCVSINKNNLKVNIIGNFELINGIQKILIKNCVLSQTKLIKHRNMENGIHIMNYGGNINCRKIYDFLYKDCNDIYLKRKKEKFEKLWKK